MLRDPELTRSPISWTDAPVDETGLLKFIDNLYGVRPVGIDQGSKPTLLDAGKILDASERRMPRRRGNHFACQSLGLRRGTNLQKLACQRERDAIGRGTRGVGSRSLQPVRLSRGAGHLTET